MRHAGLVALAAVAAACGGSAVADCSSAWIGSPSVALQRGAVVYSLGLDGSVKRAPGAESTPALQSPGAADPTGRRSAIWQQRGRHPLLLEAGSESKTIATQVATQPVWRRDGGALAFGQLVSHAIRLRIAELRPRLRIRQLGIALCPLGGPAWSPDGRFLALVSPIDQRHCERGSQLLVVDAADGGVVGRQAVDDPVPDTPAWSGDGRYAAEGSTIGKPGIALVPRSPRIGSSRLIAGCGSLSWSPRGARFAASCGGHLAIVEARTGKRVSFATSGIAPGQAGAVWSRDGTRLAATTDGGFVVAAASGHATRVRVGGCWSGWVVGFSGDGRALVRAGVAPPGD